MSKLSPGINAESIGRALLLVTLVAVGGLAWWLRAQPELAIDTSPLAALPAKAGGWVSADLPMEGTVESVLRADFNLQRVYASASGGDVVWLYVGYYGTARGGRPEHTPRGCYTGAGWAIEATRVLELKPGSDMRMNEYRVKRNGEQRLVHFWYRSHQRTGMLGGLDQNLDRALGRLQSGRADGALVRISTRLLPGEEPAARGRLLSFAALLDPQLSEHWPNEFPQSQGG